VAAPRVRAWNQVVVRVGDASVVGELIAGAVDRGAQVSGPAWTIATNNPARVEACKEAALDARRRAQAYADALGVRVGALVAVRDPGTGNSAAAAPPSRSSSNSSRRSAPLEIGEEVDDVAVGILDLGVAHAPVRVPRLLLPRAAGVQ
jgi:uncharacterized protein YggE